MGKTIPSPHDWKDWRRLRAWELQQQGWSQRDIAAALGVSKVAVSHWLGTAEREGQDPWRSHPSPGAPAKLSPAQLRRIPDFLGHGAEAEGFRGNVWICARGAWVIEQEFGVS